MPSTEEESYPYLETSTSDIKIVSDYSGLDFNAAMELDCYTYKVLVRDGLINKLSKTPEGREYLENCWLLTQTSPNKSKLRKYFNRSDT